MITEMATFTNVQEAIAAENCLEPGVYEIRVYTNDRLSNEDLSALRLSLKESGAAIKKVYQNYEQYPHDPGYGYEVQPGYYVGVQYVVPPLASNGIQALPIAIIPLIALFGILSISGIGIFKIGDITDNIGKLLLITLGGAIALAAILRKPIERIAERKF